VATVVLFALTWAKVRIVLRHFVGVHGPWNTGLSAFFAVTLATITGLTIVL